MAQWMLTQTADTGISRIITPRIESMVSECPLSVTIVSRIGYTQVILITTLSVPYSKNASSNVQPIETTWRARQIRTTSLTMAGQQSTSTTASTTRSLCCSRVDGIGQILICLSRTQLHFLHRLLQHSLQFSSLSDQREPSKKVRPNTDRDFILRIQIQITFAIKE